MNYRINGFNQIKAFYSWVFDNQDKGIKPQHVSLYNFLINQNNRNNWVEWFKCPYDLAMTGACIGNKKTYYSALKDLQRWGIIEYKPGINEWKAPLIKLEVLKCTTTNTSTVPQSEPLPTPLHIPLPTPLPTHIYKLLTSNIKPIIDNIEDVVRYINTLKNINSEDFENFWNQYHQITNMRKEDKEPALKYWKKLNNGEREKATDNIQPYFSSLKDKKFCKKARTYLSAKSFNDEFKKKPVIPFDPYRVEAKDRFKYV